MIDLVTQRSANYLIIPYLKKKNDLTRYNLFFLIAFFLLVFISMKIVMNPQAVLLLTLVAVPCTSASMFTCYFV